MRSAFAPFLPRIEAKASYLKFSEPKQAKIVCFARRKVAGILSYFKTDNEEKQLFYLFWQVRLPVAPLKVFQTE